MMARIAVFPALVAAVAVVLAGCSSKHQGQHKPKPGGAPSASASTSVAPGNVLTPKDVTGKEPLRLKFGQPVTYKRDGVSITVVPKSWEKLQETPQGLSGNMLDCGSWWSVAETWVVDADPKTAWRGWRRDFQGVFGLFSETKDAAHGFYSEVALATVPKRGEDNLDRALSEAIRKWDLAAPLHFEQSGTQFLEACTVNHDSAAASAGQQFVPDPRQLMGLEITLPATDGQNPRSWPTLAIWTP